MRKLTGRDALREKVRVRDNHTCQHCNKKWLEGERRFDVHHLEESRQSTYDYNSEELEKMITLCHKCHLAHYTDWEKRENKRIAKWIKENL